MAFETILINADSEHSLPRLVEVAQTIAARHSSQIVGLAVLPPSMTLPAGMPGAPDTMKLEAHRTSARSETERAHKLFDQLTAKAAASCTWRLDEFDGRSEIDALVAHGRLADLIVTSDTHPVPFDARPFHVAERLIVEVGRPVILVPKCAVPTSCGRRVLIACNGSREATRAVFDAMPLLQTAQHVKVLQVSTNDRARISGLSGADVCSMLSRHKVRATAEALSLPRATAGAALISAAKAENADLLVMGGYGYWRFHELVLGGATRHVLRHMTVPVLMSH